MDTIVGLVFLVVLLALVPAQTAEADKGCSAIHCKWNEWGRWSECDKSCGGFGMQFRRRSKAQRALCGGKVCDGEFEQEKSCNRFCYNGGTLHHEGECSCSNEYCGPCCQHHVPKSSKKVIFGLSVIEAILSAIGILIGVGVGVGVGVGGVVCICCNS